MAAINSKSADLTVYKTFYIAVDEKPEIAWKYLLAHRPRKSSHGVPIAKNTSRQNTVVSKPSR